MAYYSEKYAKKQKADRDAVIARAKDLIGHPEKYDRITAKGSASYVKNIAFDISTGEIVDGKNLSIHEKKSWNKKNMMDTMLSLQASLI